MATVDCTRLNKLLTVDFTRTRSPSWVAEIKELVKGDVRILNTPIEGKIPLEVLILQLKRWSEDFDDISAENIRSALETLTSESSAQYENEVTRWTPLQLLMHEMTSCSSETNSQGIQLYLYALEVVASLLQKYSQNYENILGACLYELVIMSKKFRRSFPQCWLKAVSSLCHHDASLRYRHKGNTALISLISQLIEVMPWTDEAFKNCFMEVLALLIAPEQLEEAFKFLALAACNILYAKGCVETVKEVLGMLILKLETVEDEQKPNCVSSFMYRMLMSGMGLRRTQPCNSAWADIVEYAISRGAQITYRHSEHKIETTALHVLMIVPVGVQDPCQENLTAFGKVLDLLVTEETSNAIDSSGTTPRQTLMDVKTQALSEGHQKMFEMAEEKMTASLTWPQRLYYAVHSTYKEDFRLFVTDNWVQKIKLAVEKCREQSLGLLWKDTMCEENSALLWLLMVIDELFPHPSEKHMEKYLAVLPLLQVPELMFAENKYGHTPLDAIILSARDALQASDDSNFYERVIVLMLESYAEMKTDTKLFSKSLGYLISQYTLVTQPAMCVYFRVFDILVKYGARVTYEIWKKFFSDTSTPDHLKFHHIAVSHTKSYVLLIEKIIVALDVTYFEVHVKIPLYFSWGFSQFIDLYHVPLKVTKTICYIQDQVILKQLECQDDFIIMLRRAVRNKEFDKMPTILNTAVPYSWMNRNAFHILAMLCHDKALYEALGMYCADEVNVNIANPDLSGCTPYMLSIIHGNVHANEFFSNFGGNPVGTDNFGCSANDLLQRNKLAWDPIKKCLDTKDGCLVDHCDLEYFEENCAILKRIEVRGCQHEEALLPTKPKGQRQVQNVIELFFTRMGDYMQKKHPWLECKLRMAGSIGERTKIGRTDEFDIQFIFTAISNNVNVLHIGSSNVATVQLKQGKFTALLPEDLCFEQGNLNVQTFGRILHRELINSLTSEGVCQLPIRVVKTSNPWTLVWEENDTRKGLEISIDIVPIIQIEVDVVERSLSADKRINVEGTPQEYNPNILKSKQGQIIDNARARPMKLFLRWGRPGREHRLVPTIADYERDVIDCMHPEIRCGIKIVKSLLEIAYWAEGAYYADIEKPITSYMVKNATFWLVKEAIDGQAMISMLDSFKVLSHDLETAKSSLHLYNTLQDAVMHIPGRVLEDYPKSMSLVDANNFDHRVADEWRKLVAGSIRSFTKVQAYLKKTDNMQETPDRSKGSEQEHSLPFKMKKLIALPETDDSFAFCKQPGADINNTRGHKILNHNSEEDDALPAASFNVENDSCQSNRPVSDSDHDCTVTEIGIAWAYQIVRFIKKQTTKQFGLPIFYSSDLKPDFLINKWNGESIQKVCDRLLVWLEYLLEQ